MSYTTTNNMVLVKCNRCLNEWDYKGKSPYYACCPKCLRKIKINEVPDYIEKPKDI